MNQTRGQQSEIRTEYRQPQGEQPDFRKELNLDVINADADLAVEKLRRDFVWAIVFVSCIAIACTIAAIALSDLDFRGTIGIACIIFGMAAFIIGILCLVNWLEKKKKEKDSQSVKNLDFIIEEDAVIRKREYDISSDTSTNMYYEAKFAVNGFREVDKDLYDRLSLCDRVYILKRKGTNGRDSVVRYYPESEYRPAPEIERFVARPLFAVGQAELEQMVQDERNKLLREHEELNRKSSMANTVAAWFFLIVGIVFLAVGLYGVIPGYKAGPSSIDFIAPVILLIIGAIAFLVGLCGMPKKKENRSDQP